MNLRKSSELRPGISAQLSAICPITKSGRLWHKDHVLLCNLPVGQIFFLDPDMYTHRKERPWGSTGLPLAHTHTAEHTHISSSQQLPSSLLYAQSRHSQVPALIHSRGASQGEQRPRTDEDRKRAGINDQAAKQRPPLIESMNLKLLLKGQTSMYSYIIKLKNTAAHIPLWNKW